MVRRGLARSRSHAADLIGSGAVRVGGVTTPKAASMVDAGDPIEFTSDPPPYVGRGGSKLAGAVADFGVDVAGRRALDAGASTGGFTDFLLQSGVASVAAVDVGYGQLDSRIADDPRVTVFDRTNIRHAAPADLGGPFDLVVADLSFISLCTVAESLAALATPSADLVLLVKPQFEVGKEQVGRGGIVTDPALHRMALEKVVECLGARGMGTQGVTVSPILGAKGNREFFVWCVRSIPTASELELPV
jgi:23S rRNA (cytidine1920-2'-O)/16S rRNA (cytidine1409-2'-O)-methyltransferase